MESTAENNFFRQKYTTSVAYLVAILLFLLPFVEIKCNNTTFAENTGLGLALGRDYKISGDMKSATDPINNLDKNDKPDVKTSKEKGRMYVFALVALVLGAIGLLLPLFNARSGSVNMIIGILAAVALIVVMIQLKADIKNDGKTSGTVPDETVKVTAEFTLWYYLSVISFLVAAFFSFKKGQLVTVHEHPPKNAPQIPIKNPGEQSEFPTSPDESEMER